MVRSFNFENCCRFSGILTSYNFYDFGEYFFGRGEISIGDPLSLAKVTSIRFICGSDIAERLHSVPIGSKVRVLASYQINVYNGNTYPQFELGALEVYE